jgi:hypothetical protein
VQIGRRSSDDLGAALPIADHGLSGLTARWRATRSQQLGRLDT